MKKFLSFILLFLVFTNIFIFSEDKVSKLNIGLLKLTSSAPVFIGIDKGFFKEEGIELQTQWFDAAQPIAVATASNKVEIGATGITAGLFNMVAGGQKLLIVADKGREYKGYSSSAVLVTHDLWDQGVKSIKDLKGKKIGITQTGSTFHYMIGQLLEKNGLSLKDIELVPLTKISAVTASLQSKQIDAAILNEPNISKALTEGYAMMITQVGDVIDYQTSAIFFSPDFVKNNRSLAIKFLKAYISSVRFYYDAVLTKKNNVLVPGKNFDEVISIISKYTGATIDDTKMGLPYMDRDGKLLSEDIDTQINWYFNHQMMDTKIFAKDVLDKTLWEEALKTLKK